MGPYGAVNLPLQSRDIYRSTTELAMRDNSRMAKQALTPRGEHANLLERIDFVLKQKNWSPRAW
jgi:hypothetical protein